MGSTTLMPPLAPNSTSPPENRTWIQRHPLITFYLLAFAISWLGILTLLGGPSNFLGTPEQIQKNFLPVMLAWLAGPSIASLVTTGVASGKAGYRELLHRLLRWRVGVRWYAVALVTAPLVYLSLSGLLSLISRDFTPAILVTTDRSGLLLMGLAYGLLGGGFLEELGWTGFAVPSLRQRHSILTTGLIAGILWGAYHFSVIYWATSPPPSGVFGITILLLQLFAWLPAYRLLMVWVYDRTHSLLLAMLMHASVTAGMLILQPNVPLGMAGMTLFTWLIAFAATWWIIVAVIGIRFHAFHSTVPARQIFELHMYSARSEIC